MVTNLCEATDITFTPLYLRMLSAAICETKMARRHRVRLKERRFSIFEFMNQKVLPDFQRLGGMFSFKEIFEAVAFWVSMGYWNLLSAKPVTDESKCMFMKVSGTDKKSGEPLTVLKPILEAHPLLRVPVLCPMPAPPAARFMTTTDGTANTSVVEVEKRDVATRAVITTFIHTLPFIEAMVSGDVIEEPGSNAWDVLFEAMFG